MAACFNGHLEIAKLLLDKGGVDINAKNIIFYSYNDFFTYFKFTISIWYLLKDFMSSLMGASSNGHYEIVEFLLEQKGIDINAMNNAGNTAIQLAYRVPNKNEENYQKIINLLKSQKGIKIPEKNTTSFSYSHVLGFGNEKAVANPES